MMSSVTVARARAARSYPRETAERGPRRQLVRRIALSERSRAPRLGDNTWNICCPALDVGLRRRGYPARPPSRQRRLVVAKLGAGVDAAYCALLASGALSSAVLALAPRPTETQPPLGQLSLLCTVARVPLLNWLPWLAAGTWWSRPRYFGYAAIYLAPVLFVAAAAARQWGVAAEEGGLLLLSSLLCPVHFQLETDLSERKDVSSADDAVRRGKRLWQLLRDPEHRRATERQQAADGREATEDVGASYGLQMPPGESTTSIVAPSTQTLVSDGATTRRDGGGQADRGAVNNEVALLASIQQREQVELADALATWDEAMALRMKTVKELRVMAAQLQVRGRSRMRKAELIAAIEVARGRPH
eukprot:jgi/Tetstr1/432963/TSEL_022300.t1